MLVCFGHFFVLHVKNNLGMDLSEQSDCKSAITNPKTIPGEYKNCTNNHFCLSYH